MTYDLIFFPDYTASNPYQHLLYGRLADLHPRPGTIDDALRLLDHASTTQRVIFHLHWEDVLHRHAADADAARQTVRMFLAKLGDFVARGGSLVWTVHNRSSHAGTHPDLDRALRRTLADLADRIHVHSLAAARAVRSELRVPFQKLIVLPHGNYRPLHDPRGIDRAKIRAARGWSDQEIVVLLFGRLEAYKGGHDLLEAFAAAPANLRLAIAGKQIVALDEQIGQMPPDVRSRIWSAARFLPEADLGSLVAAADFIALPYRAILTSGSLMLALSLGRPVIAPDLPAITEIVADGREALLYPCDRPGGLRKAMERLVALDESVRNEMAGQAQATGELYDWAWIGRQMGAALVDATGHGRANRRTPSLSVPVEAPG
ncbi:glycosyltransferase [Geminicoccus roseus]|uniref:glycosyltransferase n=1 Tax=Geminicoccus roseus TaxID=404900 RepID=UPI00041E2C36|nr:glycosyltransferase [Geminicoccus roseus]